jgi:hypothetical protein
VDVWVRIENIISLRRRDRQLFMILSLDLDFEHNCEKHMFQNENAVSACAGRFEKHDERACVPCFTSFQNHWTCEHMSFSGLWLSPLGYQITNSRANYVGAWQIFYAAANTPSSSHPHFETGSKTWIIKRMF